jgi:AcrR family transcriptional regulator
MRKPKAPEANRARILHAAIEEFAARGFKGASMDAIAARTHTTRALINYYFGGKEKVYLAVLEHVYGEIRQAEDRLDLDHLSPVDAIRRIVEFTYNYYLGHEGFVRLVVAENQAGGRRLRKSRAGVSSSAASGTARSGVTSTRSRSTRPSRRSACST